MVGEKQAICESAVANVGLDSDLYSYDPFPNDYSVFDGLGYLGTICPGDKDPHG